VRPWTGSALVVAGRFAGAVLAVGVVGIYAPVAICVPLVAAAGWVAFGAGRRGAVLGRAAIATVAALPLLIPWILYTDLGDLVTGGAGAFWAPSPWILAAAGIAFVAALLSGRTGPVAVGGWGGALGATGLVVARLGSLGAGVDVEIAGDLAVALGLALVVGAALDVASHRRRLTGLGARAAIPGAVAAMFLVLATLLVAGPGRVGLPGDTLTGQFDFAIPADGSTPSRILLFGTDVPGESRDLDGLPYRVIVPPYPTTLDAELNDPRLGDDALQAILLDLLDGRVRRVGDALAPFGIGWVAFTEDSPLQQLFDSQLDLVPLRSLDFPVYRNEVTAAVALAADDSAWAPWGTGFRSPDGSEASSVILADNADYRWGPGEWTQVDWHSRIDRPGSAISFRAYEPRRVMALGAGLWLLVLFGAWTVGRQSEARS
jgi:hypothetical protein